MENLKLIMFLEKISFKLKSLAIYLELKYYIKNNQNYFMRIHKNDRNIGKTYNLVKLAIKYKLPIFVPNDRSERYIKDLVRRYFKNKKNKLTIIVASEKIKGFKYNKVLVEEGIDYDIIHYIIKPMCKCMIGYINVN